MNDKFLKKDEDGNYFDLRLLEKQNGKQDITIADKPNISDVFIKYNSGNLDMMGKEIINLKPFIEDDNKKQVGQVIDFSYFHDQRQLKRCFPISQGRCE